MSSSNEIQLGAASPKQQKIVDTFQHVQIMIIGGAMGSGKSYIMTLLSSLYMDDGNSRIGFFRESLPQLEGSGGLVDTAKSIYRKIADTVPTRWVQKPYPKMTVTGGAGKGAQIEYRPMRHESDIENVRGLQYSFIGVDEGTAFSQNRLEFLMSRLRSESRHESRMVISCNPDPDHYICDMIKDYYLDDQGYPIEDRAGDIRYFYRKDGEYYWADTREEIADRFDIPREDMVGKILSFSFVGANIYDNPPLLKANPGYLAFLEGLSPVEKARNLWGNWFVRPEAEGVFKREWLRGKDGDRVKKLSDVPKGCTAMRGVDKAHAIPSEVNADPDYTALSPLGLKDRNGFYWLLGNYHPDMIDKQTKKNDIPALGRFRRLAGERDNMVAMQLKADKINAETYGYQEPRLVLAKDHGAGTGDFNSTIAVMAENGIKVIKDQTISNVEGKKMKDFLGFTSACQNGLVYIVEETFEPHSLSSFYKELEKFDGTRSTRTRKDDWVDGTSMMYNALAASKRPYRTLTRNQNVVDTLSASYTNRL